LARGGMALLPWCLVEKPLNMTETGGPPRQGGPDGAGRQSSHPRPDEEAAARSSGHPAGMRPLKSGGAGGRPAGPPNGRARSAAVKAPAQRSQRSRASAGPSNSPLAAAALATSPVRRQEAIFRHAPGSPVSVRGCPSFLEEQGPRGSPAWWPRQPWRPKGSGPRRGP
jgi:hypothetical protein